MRNGASPDDRFGLVVGGENWGMVPYPLYKYQWKLGLRPNEVWFLTWVIMHKWRETDSFPSISALSRYSGLSRQGIQDIIRRLKGKGLINVDARYNQKGARLSNVYDTSPLLEKLEEFIREDEYSAHSQRNKKFVPADAYRRVAIKEADVEEEDDTIEGPLAEAGRVAMMVLETRAELNKK